MTPQQRNAIVGAGIPLHSLEKVETLDVGRTLRVHYRSYLGLGESQYSVITSEIPVGA